MLRTILSARDTAARLSEQPPVPPLPRPAADGPSLRVDPTRRMQALEGFGGAFTEAAAVNWLALSPATRDAALRAYFASPADGGHGYSLCRVPMGSCDFALGNYSHLEAEGDLQLRGFSIERDTRALLRLVHAARRVAAQPLRLLVSPWSPPAWMKDNRSMNGGGKLLPEYRQAWAECFVRFIQACAEQGLDIWGVTPQNEPMAAQRWDSCLYSAEEEAEFIGAHLGPALRRAGLHGVRIVGWDHNRDLLGERASVLYGHERAREYLWGLGFHWYGEPCWRNVQRVHEAWPDKRLLLTEACQEGGPHRDSWEVGERYAQSMIADLDHGSVGWIDWNLFLDLQGGPNHVGNYCSAPVLLDAAADRWLPQPSYDCIGHFARYIRPGWRRVLCAPSSEAIEATAFVGGDGELAIVVLNRQDRPLQFRLRIAAADYAAALPPHAIATFLADAPGN